MLWYKSWLETRWRFLIGLFVLMCSAAGSVVAYPYVVKMTATMPVDMGGMIGARVREAVELAHSFRGYIWSNWFRQNLVQIGTLLSILLGIASLASESGGALFTLSLPVSRQRLLHVRAATGLAELFTLVLIPTLLVPLLAPVIGQHYSVASAVVHTICFFAGATLFFSIAILLSTIFSDPWRPLMIAIGAAFALGLAGLFDVEWLGVFRVMSGESWFRESRMPWIGLVATAAVSASIYFGAVRNLVRRDF